MYTTQRQVRRAAKLRSWGKAYLLTHIDPALWIEVKTRAAAEGHSLRWILLQLLIRYVRQGLG